MLESRLNVLRKQIFKYLKNGGGIYSSKGACLVMYKTLKDIGLSDKNRYYRAVLLEQAQRLKITTSSPYDKGFVSRVNRPESMPLGPKTKELGWELTQQSAVYEIVCSGSGNRYIGSSTRPDLRRANHYYWVKQPWKYGISNVYFGNKKLWRDVQKYGYESFYCEIIHSRPGWTNEQLEVLEQEVIDKADKRKLYNTRLENKNQPRYEKFAALDPTLKKMVKEYNSTKPYERLVAQIEKEKAIYEDILSRKWPIREKPVRLSKQLSKLRALRIKKQLLVPQRNEARLAIQARMKYLIKKFSEIETPLY